MKKFAIILTCIILVLLFIALVRFGFRHARGIPVVIEEKKLTTLEVPFVDKDIDLAKGISLEFWDTLSGKEIELLYQLMVLPWGESLVSPITVKAFYNRKDIYFYITWHDDSQNRTIGMNKFSDACAILFPLDTEAQPPTIMMGFIGGANIWQWKASQDREYWKNLGPELEAYVDFYYPFEEEEVLVVSKEPVESAANDLIAIRVGTITPKEKQNVKARGFWLNGIWHVVFKRSLAAIEPEVDAVFVKEKRLTAFAVYNGETGDRGGRKSISDWVALEVKL